MDETITPSAFLDLVTRQRAHRAFEPEPVGEETIAFLIEAAVRAPSAENRQPWEFVVVRDADTRERIGELTAKAWDSGARSQSEKRLDADLLAEVDAGARGGISAAPVLIVVCADTNRCHPATIGSSIFPAVQNLLLAATSLGLGSALTTLTTVLGDELSGLIGLPNHVRPVAVVPVGTPARRLGRSKREPFASRTHDGKFGVGWQRSASTASSGDDRGAARAHAEPYGFER